MNLIETSYEVFHFPPGKSNLVHGKKKFLEGILPSALALSLSMASVALVTF